MTTLEPHWSLDTVAPVYCPHCEWYGEARELEAIRDAQYVLEPGKTMPGGSCPECGRLAYLCQPPRIVHLAIIASGGEINVILKRSHDQLVSAVSQYCRGKWSTISDQPIASSAEEETLIQTYFQASTDEIQVIECEID